MCASDSKYTCVHTGTNNWKEQEQWHTSPNKVFTGLNSAICMSGLPITHH